MPFTLFDSLKNSPTRPTSILVGTVTNNIDLVAEGKIQVRLPTIDQDVWARLCAPGAGDGFGLFYVPRIDDEVLIAINENDPNDAFVVGGLWSAQAQPPTTTPLSVSTRSFVTGMIAGQGHTVTFDDVTGSMSISTPLNLNKVILDLSGITIKANSGAVQISLSATGQISIQAPMSIDLKSPTINLTGAEINISGTAKTTITGAIVSIN
jgi:uncharacterized protein involved in type VI secretion and phage assembly